MNGNKIFFDTNMIVYLYSDTELEKRKIVKDAFDINERYISTQVLNEFSNIAFKKLKLPAIRIDNIIDELMNVCFVSVVDSLAIHNAIAIKDRYSYSYYDSLIIASALECDCKILYSEDMSNGQIIENIMIQNLFLQ
ncbi:twitching motility protein PilT [Spirochaetia bacterium]|nr:twitching motility protein PilT [Spirochaetia bacterium]